MARSNVNIGGTPFKLDIDVENFDVASAAFRELRNRTARELRNLMVATADDQVLPTAIRNVRQLRVGGQSVSQSLRIVKGSGNAVILSTTLRGALGRAAGLLEYGGTVHTPIKPTHGKRAVLVNGSPRAIVRKARHYRAHLGLTHAVEEEFSDWAAELRNRVVLLFPSPPFSLGVRTPSRTKSLSAGPVELRATAGLNSHAYANFRAPRSRTYRAVRAGLNPF